MIALLIGRVNYSISGGENYSEGGEENAQVSRFIQVRKTSSGDALSPFAARGSSPPTIFHHDINRLEVEFQGPNASPAFSLPGLGHPAVGGQVRMAPWPKDSP